MAKTEHFMLQANDWLPNNARLPVILYRDAVPRLGAEATATAFEELFGRNGWPAQWRNGIYGFHHYHPAAHEVLGIAAGATVVELGGPGGHVAEVAAGDALLLPAGTGHCRIGEAHGLLVVGGYPPGQTGDIARSAISPAALHRLMNVPFPASDPVEGRGGTMTTLWKA